MGFSKHNYKASSTRKRFDMEVQVRPMFSSDWRFGLRLLSPEELSESEVDEAIQQVVDRKKEWKKTKTGYMLTLNGLKGANAYITKKETSNDSE